MTHYFKPVLFYLIVAFVLAIRSFGGSVIVAKQYKDQVIESTWKEAIEASLMFRYAGDISYYPQISSLAKGNLREPVLSDYKSEYISGFPLISTIPFSLGQKIFGGIGILIADYFLSLLIYFLMAITLKLIFESTLFANLASLLFVSGFLNYLLHAGHSLVTSQLPFWAIASLILAGCIATTLLWSRLKSKIMLANIVLISLASFSLIGGEFFYDTPSILWLSRIPRPLGTQIYFWMILFCLLFLWKQKALVIKPYRYSLHEVLCIVSLGFLLQGDFHSFITMSFLVGSLLFYLIFLHTRHIQSRSDIVFIFLKKILGYLLIFLISISFFLIQQTLTSPDLSPRLGLTSIPRFPGMFFIDNINEIFSLILWIFGFIVLTKIFEINPQLNRYKQNYVKITYASFYLILLGFLSPSLLQFFLGKTIQPSQFIDRFRLLMGLFLYTQGIWILIFSWNILKPKTLSNYFRSKSIMTVFTFFLALSSSFFYTYSNSKKNSHVRSNYPEFSRYEGNYKYDFFELIHHVSNLSRDANDGELSIASLDVAVYSWTTSFTKIKSFLVDPFLSLAPDSVMEERIKIFMKILGVETKDYIEYIQRFYFLTLWLGHLKYQPTPYVIRQDFASFNQSNSETLRKLSPFDCWDVAMPEHEIERLKSNYAGFSLDGIRKLPDYIVSWKQDEITRKQNINPLYRLLFENRTFQLWQNQLQLPLGSKHDSNL